MTGILFKGGKGGTLKRHSELPARGEYPGAGGISGNKAGCQYRSIVDHFLRLQSRASILKRDKSHATESFASLFRAFQKILELNNKVLELMADMGDKLGGDYVFDGSTSDLPAAGWAPGLRIDSQFQCPGA